METNRFHRARQSALECPRMAIAKSDELHEKTASATEGRRWHIGGVPANHRARQCALECPRMAIAKCRKSFNLYAFGIFVRLCI